MVGITIFVRLSRRWPESCPLNLRSTRKTKYSVDDSDNKGSFSQVPPFKNRYRLTRNQGAACDGVILVLRRVS